MEKLFALVTALEGSGLINPEKILYGAEDGAAEYVEAYDGPDLILFRHTYTGVIELQGIAGDLRDLLAVVVTWLNENADPDTDALASWEGEPLDKERSDIMLRLQFEEAAHYVQAAGGYTGPDKVTVGGIDYQRTEALTADRATDLVDPVEMGDPP